MTTRNLYPRQQQKSSYTDDETTTSSRQRHRFVVLSSTTTTAEEEEKSNIGVPGSSTKSTDPLFALVIFVALSSLMF